MNKQTPPKQKRKQTTPNKQTNTPNPTQKQTNTKKTLYMTENKTKKSPITLPPNQGAARRPSPSLCVRNSLEHAIYSREQPKLNHRNI